MNRLDSTQVAIFYALANAPGVAAAYLLIDRLGRRKLLAYAMTAASTAGVVLALAIGDGERPRKGVAVAAALAVNACSAAGFSSLDALAAESFAADRRATAVGLLCAVGRVASIAAQLVNAALAERPALLVFATAALMCLGAVATFALPEPADAAGLEAPPPAPPPAGSGSQETTALSRGLV